MIDLITVGRIGIDIFYKGKAIDTTDKELHLALGQKYFVDELYEGVGGGGANVAAAAVQNGISAGVLGFVGNNPFKTIILDKLQALHIDTSLCQFKDNYLNISSIFVMSGGERTIVDYETPHKELFSGAPEYDLLSQAKAVYLASLPDIPLSSRIELLTKAKNRGKLVLANLGTRDQELDQTELQKLLDMVDVLFMNKVEFSKLANVALDSLDLSGGIFSTESQLSNKTVIITDGRSGSYGYHDDQVFHQEAIEPEKVLDTTGAGDAFTGAFIAQYLKDEDIKNAMEKGAKHASYIIAKVGAN